MPNHSNLRHNAPESQRFINACKSSNVVKKYLPYTGCAIWAVFACTVLTGKGSSATWARFVFTLRSLVTKKSSHICRQLHLTWPCMHSVCRHVIHPYRIFSSMLYLSISIRQHFMKWNIENRHLSADKWSRVECDICGIKSIHHHHCIYLTVHCQIVQLVRWQRNLAVVHRKAFQNSNRYVT